MSLLSGLGLLAVTIIAWIAMRRLQRRQRLKKHRKSWEQRGTVLRIKHDQQMRARDPDLETRPPTFEDGLSSRRRERK